MNHNENIENTIKNVISDVTSITINDTNQNLVGKNSHIMPSDFLYIFEILEQKYNVQLCNIFTTHGYEIMTIKNLANAIIELKNDVLWDG